MPLLAILWRSMAKTQALCPVALLGLLFASASRPIMPLGRTRTTTIRRNEVHTYQVWIPAGYYARVEVDQRDIDLTFEARDPDGRILVRMNGSPWGQEAVAIISKRPGLYQLWIVAPLDDSEAGAYAIRRVDLRPAMSTDQAVLRAQKAFVLGVKALEIGTKQSLAEASEWLTASASDAHRTGDARREAQALRHLGVLYTRTGDYDKALGAFEQAHRLFTALHDNSAVADVLSGLSGTTGHVSAILDFVPTPQGFLKLWRRTSDRRGVAVALSKLGTEAQKRRDLKQAEAYLLKALALRRQLGAPSWIAVSLEDLGGLALDAHHQGAARTYVKKALTIYQSTGDKRGEASTLYTLGLADQSDRPDQALAEYEASRQLRHTQGDVGAESEVLCFMANLEYQRGRYEAAAMDSKQGLALDQALDARLQVPQHRAGFIANSGHAAVRIKALMRLHERFPTEGYAAEAFEVADQTIAHHLQKSSTPMRTAKDLVAALPDDDTTVLEYWLSRDESKGWAVNREGVTAFELPPEGRIQILYKEFMKTLQEPQYLPIGPGHASLELTHLLLSPVKDQLRKRLLVAGNGPIEGLPFASLPDPDDEQRILIESHDLAYVPSISRVLDLQNDRATYSPSSELAVVADPIFDSGDARLHHPSRAQGPDPLVASAVRAVGLRSADPAFWRLPFAAREAQEVVLPVPAGKWSSYSGLQASPENFLRAADGRYRIVHVITHALDNERNPDLSGLILTLVGQSGERRDGFLQLGTIYGAHIKASLIVLSACETAEGEELSNEGLMGLTSAFLYAGAERVLSTAWKIDDEGTAEFMRHFYRALYGPPRRAPAEAVRIAQLEMRHTLRWKSPFYWSGFLLHGDWSWTW